VQCSAVLVSLEIEQLVLFLVVQIDREIKEHILALQNKKVLVSIFLFVYLFIFQFSFDPSKKGLQI
jgi:uncharacterized membrane protein YozB (DUF420 family)